MVDRPETDGAVYVTGWTISGLAVLGAIVAVWVLGIEPGTICATPIILGCWSPVGTHLVTLTRRPQSAPGLGPFLFRHETAHPWAFFSSIECQGGDHDPLAEIFR